MAILQVLKYPDPFLKIQAERVTVVDAGIKGSIRDRTETMYYSRGIGLAAVQVGVNKRVIVLDVPDEEDEEDDDGSGAPKRGLNPFKPAPDQRGKNLIALINPEIIEASGSVVFEEGCLSVPGQTADVERAACVRVRALNKDGQTIEVAADRLYAIALQHEIDHLDGILFIDRISRLKRELIKRRIRKAQESEEKAL